MKKNAFLLFFLVWGFYGSSQTTKQEQTSNTEVIQPKTVKVFPNPANNVVNILGLSNSAKAKISIWDMYGNVVLEHRWEIRNNALNIPIPTLTTGIYVITISSEEQYVRTKFYKK